MGLTKCPLCKHKARSRKLALHVVRAHLSRVSEWLGAGGAGTPRMKMTYTCPCGGLWSSRDEQRSHAIEQAFAEHLLRKGVVEHLLAHSLGVG